MSIDYDATMNDLNNHLEQMIEKFDLEAAINTSKLFYKYLSMELKENFNFNNNQCMNIFMMSDINVPPGEISEYQVERFCKMSVMTMKLFVDAFCEEFDDGMDYQYAAYSICHNRANTISLNFS